MGTQQMPRQCLDAHTGGAGGGSGGGAVGGCAAPITSSALVIVQLSHLDRFAVVCGERAAHALASRLIHELHGVQRLHAWHGRLGLQGQHVVGAPMGGPVGLVVLADAQWPLGPASAPRRRVLTVLSATPQVVWVHQDLSRERWQDAQQRLVAEVQRLRIRSARVGGWWATRSGAPSGVSTTAAALYRAGIQTQIAPGLCAYEDDLPGAMKAPPPAPTASWSASLATSAAAEDARREEEAAFLRFLVLF